MPVAADSLNLPPPVDPIQLYGDQMQFDVLRDGEPIGKYFVFFREKDGELQVETRASIEVELFLISNYRLRYQSVEKWRDGVLSELTASTNDDGDYSQIAAELSGDEIMINGTEGTWEAEPSILPTTHWNIAQLSAPTLINTVSGVADHVSVTEAGLEDVPFGDGTTPARHFIYSGDLEMEAWYDDEGRWVGLRFAAEDGSTIEYRCRRCSAPTRLTDAQ
jgi:hypothetical protein